jgi:nitroreductase
MRDGSTTDGWAALWRARYGEAPEPPPGQADDVLATILRHRSVRAYADRPLPPGTLETLVAAAQSAPTSSNLQTWSVVAVEDADRRRRLAALAGNQRHVAAAPLVLVFLADLARLDAVAAARGEPAGALDAFEMFLVAAIDAALAAQNAVVTLEALGLGACYIGAMRNRPEEVAAELGLPPRVAALFALTVGVPDPGAATAVKPRLPQGVVLHRERYEPAGSAAIEAYDGRIQVFQAEQGMSVQPWSAQASARVRGPEALSGRDRLVAALRQLGFGLR